MTITNIPEHEVHDAAAGYRCPAANGSNEVDDVSDADYVPLRLNDYPSGLNYYYFISTLISVVPMIILRRTTDEDKLLADLEAKKKDPKQMKKTGFGRTSGSHAETAGTDGKRTG